jgi:hypothetical protein
VQEDGTKRAYLATPRTDTPALIYDDKVGKRNHYLYQAESIKALKLSIAGIVVEFVADASLRLAIPDPHNRFVVTTGIPELALRVHYGQLPELNLEEKIFDSGGVWSLYRSGSRYVIILTSYLFGPSPYEMAVINPEFNRGDIYIRPVSDPRRTVNLSNALSESEPTIIDPTGYPLDEVLMVSLLSRGHGVELHGCGVVLVGRGVLFSGVSGAGKSTLADLWKKRPDVPILSDDRIVVRRIDGRFWMFGTPWHGDAKTALPRGVPLERVFYIKHSPENYNAPLKTSEVVSRLFVRCFPTFWDQAGILFTLGLLGKIAEAIPCSELGFVPNDSVLDFVNQMMIKSA